MAIDSDDPAIWLNPLDLEASLVIGTDKGSSSSTGASRNGALYLFDLNGSIIEERTVHGLARPNNVDVEYGLRFQGSTTDIAVFTERYVNRIRVYRLPEMEPIDGGGIPVFEGESQRAPMGIALYRRRGDGTVFAIASRKSGPKEHGYLWQYRLEDAGDGTIRGVRVREFGVWSGIGEIEAVAVDDALGYVYASDELVGVRKYFADPAAEGADEELALFGTDGFVGDREGVSIYEVTDSTGYILVSDQQGNTFHVYRREGEPANPHDHRRVRTVRLAALNSDGSEATSRLSNDDFPGGLFVAMSADRTFHFYSWLAISGGELSVAVWSPSNRARLILRDSRYTWTSIETASARIHYAEGSFAERERDILADRVESALQAIQDGLRIPDYPVTVDVFYVDAREDMRRLTGSPVTGFAFIESHTVVLVFNEEWRAFERHELTHVISRNVWGEPGEPTAATLEAFATFVDGDCGGYEIGRVVRTVLEKDSLLDWEPLLGAFRAQDDLIAYLQAASLVEFVASQGIEEGLPELWSGGLGAAPGLLGVSRGELESGWLEWLRASYMPIPDQAWQRIRSDGCGIQARPAAQGDR